MALRFQRSINLFPGADRSGPEELQRFAPNEGSEIHDRDADRRFQNWCSRRRPVSSSADRAAQQSISNTCSPLCPCILILFAHCAGSDHDAFWFVERSWQSIRTFHSPFIRSRTDGHGLSSVAVATRDKDASNGQMV